MVHCVVPCRGLLLPVASIATSASSIVAAHTTFLVVCLCWMYIFWHNEHPSRTMLHRTTHIRLIGIGFDCGTTNTLLLTVIPLIRFRTCPAGGVSHDMCVPEEWRTDGMLVLILAVSQYNANCRAAHKSASTLKGNNRGGTVSNQQPLVANWQVDL